MMRGGEGGKLNFYNYFIPGLGSDKKQKLQEAAVAFCDMDIDGEAGLVVDDANIARFLKVLGAEIEVESATSYEGIVKISLKEGFHRPQYKVDIAVWNGKNYEGFKKIAEEILLPVIKKNIGIDVPHKKVSFPLNDGRFFILFWSSPSGQVQKSPPTKIWGIDVDCRDQGFLPSGQGIPITDETGYAMAEIVENRLLYIHYDLCDRGSPQELAIFRRLLEEVVVELSATPEQKAERLRQLAEAKRVRSRQQYVQECSKRFEKTLAGTKRSITEGEARIAQLQQEIAKKIRETAGAKRKLEQLETCKGGELEKYGREFDKLLTVPKVLDVQVADGVVKVFTDTLFCTDPRSKIVHEIGKFRIEIYSDCQNGGVRWYNLTRRVDAYEKGMHAPHVFPQGNACYGNTAEIWPELIGNYEFAAAAQVAIQFIESVNTDDGAGKHIDKWPVATPAGGENA